MAKINVNYADLKDALEKAGLLDWKDNPVDYVLELEIKEAAHPGDGDLLDVLTITLDKEENDYSHGKSPVRKVVEIFADDANQDLRVSTQKIQRIPRRTKKKDEVPF